MPEIYTHFKYPEANPTPSGNEFLSTYQEEIDKDGNLRVVETGKICIYDMIQTHLEETKIENILKAVALGDLSALQQREATYADTTNMPKNLMEAQNLVIRAKNEFENFPLEVRKLFDNSAEKYVSEMGTADFLEKMAPYNKKMKDIKEAGSMKEYQKKVKEAARFEKDVAAAKEAND